MVQDDEERHLVQRQFSLMSKKPSNSGSKITPTVVQASQQSVDTREMLSWTGRGLTSKPPKAQLVSIVTEAHRDNSYERHEDWQHRLSNTDDESVRGLRINEWLGTEADKNYLTSEYSKSSGQHRTAYNRKANGGFIQCLKCMYGKETYDEKFAQLWAAERQEPVDYPERWKRVMLLISAILPYMIVSQI